MADLHKFIRQQFSDNNWAKECDVSSISIVKLKEIAESFCQLDVKSKLNIILTYCNSAIPTDPEIAKYVESVTLQALVEENSFVRAIATVLHSRQNFGHLTFDISETNDTFAKTLENLSSHHAVESTSSKVPLLAELLDTRITDAALTPSSHLGVVTSNCLNSLCGFRLRCKTPALKMKEAYLDRLHEECERRRVHVPIPGRSFGKQESFEDIPLDGRNNQHLNDNSHQDTTVGSRRAPSFPRRSSMARKSDIGDGEASVAGSPGPAGASSLVGSSARAKLLAMQSRPSVASGTNGASGAGGAGNPSRRMMLLSSTETGERSSLRLLSSSSTSAAGNRRSAGIKLLDFEDLPATGIQAKRLRREQLEKEREEKRREREEKARERREARDAARQARLLAPGTNSKLANPSSPPLPLHNPPPPPPPPRLAVAPAKVPEIDESERPARNHHARHLPDEEDDDDDYDDEEEEGCSIRNPGGFNESLPQPAVSLQPQQAAPAATIVLKRSAQGGHFVPQLITTNQSAAVQPGIFQAVPGNPRIRFIRPWAPQPVQDSGTEAVAATTTRFVQLPDGRLALATAPPQQAQQPQQQTVFIANPGTVSPITFVSVTSKRLSKSPVTSKTKNLRCSVSGVSDVGLEGAVNASKGPLDNLFQIQMAAAPATQLPISLPSTFQAAATPNSTQVFVRTPTLANSAQKHTVVVSPSLPQAAIQLPLAPTAVVGQGVPLSTATRLQPRVFTNPGLGWSSWLNNTDRPDLSISRKPGGLMSGAMTALGSHGIKCCGGILKMRVGFKCGIYPFVCKLIQIRPRMPVPSTGAVTPAVAAAATAATTGVSPTPATPAATIPVILPSLNAVASGTSTTTTTIQQPRILVASSATSVSPVSACSTSQPQQQQPTTLCSQLMRIVPRAPLSTSASPSTAVDAATSKPPQQPQATPSRPREEFRLTTTQLNSIHSLFQDANCLSRPDKAIILSFVSGQRGNALFSFYYLNPHPEAGSALRIRLSEYRERVIDAASGKVMEVAADTFIHLDYATGKFERVKSYRSLPSDQLMALPVLPGTPH
ncbi:unnamed protein product [Mesocestoides corti]|uniref:Uncharacterized protein n=1 Tax=Mesocestoides corti TaxID=53468 RepID=A0A0R3UEC7_MESCO|nr:unnamed protein product [Mesocestoides corti]